MTDIRTYMADNDTFGRNYFIEEQKEINEKFKNEEPSLLLELKIVAERHSYVISKLNIYADIIINGSLSKKKENSNIDRYREIFYENMAGALFSEYKNAKYIINHIENAKFIATQRSVMYRLEDINI